MEIRVISLLLKCILFSVPSLSLGSYKLVSLKVCFGQELITLKA